MPYTYICRDGDASIYADEHGTEHVIADNLMVAQPLRLLVDLDTAFSMANDQRLNRDDFVALLIEPDDIEDVDQCAKCDKWEWSDDSVTLARGDVLCDSCSDQYTRECYHCEERDYSNEMFWVEGHPACYSCHENHTSYCERCDESYWHDSDSHADCDRQDCGCETAHGIRHVRLVSDGSDIEVLEADTRHTVALPEVISPSAQDRIYRLLNNHFGELRMETGQPCYWAGSYYAIGTEWKVDGRTYAKRLRTAIYKDCAYSLPAALVEEIGNIARSNSVPVEVEVEVTWDLNMDPNEYANSGSCWWTDYAYSRCTLKAAGGFALRSFRSGSRYAEVDGRSWVVSLKVVDDRHENAPRFVVTSGEADAYVLFNSYGELGNNTGARVLSAMTGLPYRSVSSGDNWNMYVNGNSCYLIAPQDVLDQNLRLPSLGNNC